MGGSTYAGGEAVLFSGITGTTWDELKAADPAAARLIDSLVRSAGTQLLFIGLLSLAVSVFGLRRGQRWAWLTMWLWPLYLLLVVTTLALTEKVPGAGIPVPVISGTILLIVTSDPRAVLPEVPRDQLGSNEQLPAGKRRSVSSR